MEQSVITRTVTVAPGRFAPGHLGELTQQLPFEMVDAVLAQTGRTESRVRDLPARVVVYLLLAGCLFAGAWLWRRSGSGCVLAWTASRWRPDRRGADPRPPPPWPSAAAGLFDLLRGPAPVSATPGVRWRGLLVCAIDGTTLSVADTPANLGGLHQPRRPPRRLGLSAAAPGRLGGLRHPQP